MGILKWTVWSAFFLLVGCSSLAPRGRTFLDSSTRKDNPPGWVRDLRTSWEEGEGRYYKATQTIRGDERVGGCFELARLDAREALLTEIATELKGSVDQASQSLSESAELVLGKVRTGEFQGRVAGLRSQEQYFERYLIDEVERVDCHVLTHISKGDYLAMKRSVIDRVVAADPRLREAISQKQLSFFGAPRPSLPVSLPAADGEPREPASEPKSPVESAEE